MSTILDMNGVPLFPQGLPARPAVVEREFYFENEEGMECYMLIVRRLVDGERFSAGFQLNPEDPIVDDITWHNLMMALKHNENLEVILHDEYIKRTARG